MACAQPTAQVVFFWLPSLRSLEIRCWTQSWAQIYKRFFDNDSVARAGLDKKSLTGRFHEAVNNMRLSFCSTWSLTLHNLYCSLVHHVHPHCLQHFFVWPVACPYTAILVYSKDLEGPAQDEVLREQQRLAPAICTWRCLKVHHELDGSQGCICHIQSWFNIFLEWIPIFCDDIHVLSVCFMALGDRRV